MPHLITTRRPLLTQGGFVEKMKQKIYGYLTTENEDFFEFLKTLSNRKADPFKNASTKDGWVEYWYPRKYMSRVTGQNCNIFFDVKDIDFTKFSWNFMKQYSQDQELLGIVKAIDELNQEVTNQHYQFRIKRLRIHLFTSLSYVGSPYFDISTYKKCVARMYEAMRLLNQEVGKTARIISTTYDSVAYIGSVDVDSLRKVLPEFKVREYDVLVHFRNLLATKIKFGDWRIRRITGTNYDDVKEKVVRSLMKQDFGEAIMTLNKSSINDETKAKYIKDVLQCKKEVSA